MEKQTTNNYLYGKFLGYPDCCIEALGDVAIFYFMRPQNVQDAARNGFFPCSKHADMLLNNEITYADLINPNRQCTVPFTEEPTREEDLQVLAELNIIRFNLK